MTAKKNDSHAEVTSKFQINRKSLIGKAYMPWRKEYEIKKHQLTKYLDDYRHPIYPQVKAALEEWISEILEE